MFPGPQEFALNWALRGAAVALILVFALLVWRDRRHSDMAYLTVAMALSACAYAVFFGPGFADLPPALWKLPLLALSEGGSLVLWLLGSRLFDDDFRLRRRHGLAWFALGGLGVLQFYWLLPRHSPWCATVGVLLDTLPVLFALLTAAQALRHWSADLVEGRRRLRAVLVLGVTADIAVVAATKLYAGTGSEGTLVSLVDAIALSALAVWMLLKLTALRDGPNAWVFDDEPAVAGATSTAQADRNLGGVRAGASDGGRVETERQLADVALLAALRDLMDAQRIYRQDDLSIGSLAARMGLPEYRLRRLINRGLGQRNFNAFVNAYRLADAKLALADPARARLPVLSIALECGFASLGPFNRAFKADTGMTPSEFRRAHPPGVDFAEK